MTDRFETIDMFADSVQVIDPDIRKREWMTRSWRCPFCGEVSPNGHHMENNHGIDENGRLFGYPIGQHPIYPADQCSAQHLLTNQIRAAVKYHDRCGDEHLQGCMRRGKQLGLDVAEIVRAPGGTA